MTLPATDNFNRSNGALGANWSGGPGNDLTIVSSAVTAGSPWTTNTMYWSADTPDAAQYAQAKIAVVGSSQAVLCRANATDWVGLVAQSSQWDIEWYNGGSWTVIGSAYATGASNGDIGKITANGSTFTGYINGTERISGSNGSAPASGGGGIFVYVDDGSVDDFEVGNLTVAGDPEGSLVGGKLLRGGLLMHGVLVRG